MAGLVRFIVNVVATFLFEIVLFIAAMSLFINLALPSLGLAYGLVLGGLALVTILFLLYKRWSAKQKLT